jgi:hypothetical protein
MNKFIFLRSPIKFNYLSILTFVSIVIAQILLFNPTAQAQRKYRGDCR